MDVRSLMRRTVGLHRNCEAIVAGARRLTLAES